MNNTGRITGGISFLDVATTTNTVKFSAPGSEVGGAIAARGLGTNV